MKSAYEIAKSDLLACFQDGGIVASADHFEDIWARDSFFASWGALEIGEEAQVKSNLELFIKYQKKNGQIPRRLDRFFVPLEYAGIKVRRKKLKLEYKGAYIFPALDPNLLFVITCFKYFKKTEDQVFLSQNFEKIQSAMIWAARFEKNKFLQENIFANWMDVIVKRGAVLYTNVLYFDALRAFAKICEILNKSELSKKYFQAAQDLKENINKVFWNGEYYIDWICGRKKYAYFSTEGNILAIYWGIANKEKAEKIIQAIQKWKMDEIPMKTNFPNYPWWRVALRMYLIGTPGYQNNYASWLWLGCVYAMALKKIGETGEAEKIKNKITQKIEEFQKVYEIYAPDGKPYRGWFWKSAATFAWSSGLYLWMKKNE
ncbi:MAG: GH116 family glycosyl hydrolase [Parcubacteria group bacterium]|jgi:glycogen debranching enzyme